jgi:hypothetical protein
MEHVPVVAIIGSIVKRSFGLSIIFSICYSEAALTKTDKDTDNFFVALSAKPN